MSTKEKKKEHLTRSILIGYISIIVLAVCAGAYIFNLITKIANEKEIDTTSKEKVFIITQTLSLLYENEAYTQFLGMPDEDFAKFNETFDQVQEQMGLLRSYMPDTTQWEKIDKIDLLLEQKRTNTEQLLHIVKEMEGIYSRNLRRTSSSSNDPIKEVEVKKQEDVKQDTVVVQRQKKGFFKRLAEAFAPTKEDTTIVVNTTSQVKTDSTIKTDATDESIDKVLTDIQSSIAGERALLSQRLQKQVNALRYNNNIITNEINQLLLEIEEEAMLSAHLQEEEKQAMVHRASEHLGVIAVVSIIIVLIFLFIAMRDISRSRYYRRQLEKAKLYTENLLQRREKLMLTISHDIRAPLSSILGYVGLLKKKPEDKQEEYLDHVDVSANHILALVNDLLDFHRLDSGQVEINPVPFSVPVLFDELQAAFKPLADAKGLALETSIEETDKGQTYLGDTVRIRQVISNLLSNAIKFTSKGSIAMHVSLNESEETDKRLLHVSVKDEGRGISQEEQEKIFDEFTRLTGTEKIEGFGLGLSITGKLVSLMDGTISLESKPGEGSEFTVVIPVSLAPDASEQTTSDTDSEPAEPAIDSKINCLIVDDDMLQLKLTEELLKSNHVNVIGVTDTDMVLSLLENGKFDIVLTDIQMPGMDGYSLLKHIRTSGLSGADTIPVIALSASNAEEEIHYQEAGFTGFLVKPFTANNLISLLNKIFSVEIKANDSLNIASLTSFAEGDKEAKESILKTFTEETGKSIALLEEALSAEDKKQAARISHKLIPLFTMLEANTLVQKLRILEKEEEMTDSHWRELLQEAIDQATSIVRNISTGGV